MQLTIAPASAGVLWAKQGVQTFFKQPLAMSGLFFMFIAAISLASLIPFVGSVMALAMLPAATLGLMAASVEATKGKFPMPVILLSAFRAGRGRMRAMLVLGAMYAAGFLVVMGVSALFDGGSFARLYLVGGAVTREMVEQAEFQQAMWAALALYLPLSLLFWHAPALVYWHEVNPVKALFFSGVACLRNLGAFTVYGLVWLAIFSMVMLAVVFIGVAAGGPGLVSVLMVPIALVLAAMFFTSTYFTFCGSFVRDTVN